ncbi:COX15/CtaA family protein [Legionella israelensis]|uniref:Cytochrome c oxidase assembly protein n=1 Tax=Legionella israelensis TaxID=454 RepID=A0A0W0V4B9_9GAMM|nr:COX15/CtaA family protein [Legionella israelensis]KTD14961.1 cytochrome c oxidase assembly protein [Legionella israelensis]QBS10040.1 heme A synthase [Legionella israelensis]SCX78627.1 cytochrome c oxidase assembly protein subunit 15 [Legionella israelensis DSM 19235]STX59623.1 cytochrome c oxidase assembly protein [Legionella israelensis]
MSVKPLKKMATLAMFLALCVVMLGAYTRLTDAGLGCPDWPGCYGRMVLPSTNEGLNHAQIKYPQLPIEKSKAWTEMVHRYAAGMLALLIFGMLLTVWHKHRKGYHLPWHLPVFLLFLVIFQALLGMWTVTLKLLPVVVMAHLLGGIMIFSSLCRFRAELSEWPTENLPSYRLWIGLAVIIVFCQIALGGWVSANYAGVSCVGFPSCNGVFWPSMHFSEGFNLFSPVGANYQGGLLENEVRVSIQMVHRVGAIITALYVLALSSTVLVRSKPRSVLFMAAALALVLVLIQFTLGVMNVIYLLPLPVAVAHNGVAALLLATLFTMLHLTKSRRGGYAN